MSKKALIIGGGHNGLVCAAYLAKAGLDVTVLEKQQVVGGAAITEEFHPGFRNSVASYTVSLLHPRVIEDLNLFGHGLNIIERQINNFVPLPNGDGLTSYPDAREMESEVARFSTGDAASLAGFYEELDSVVELFRDLMLEIPPSLHGEKFGAFNGIGDMFSMLALGNRFRKMSAAEKRLLLKLFSSSAGELLDDRFESDPLKALIGFDAIVGNYASPYQAGSAYVLLHHVIGEVNGKRGRWGHAVGGMGAISQAISEEAVNCGVQIETGVAVEKVLVTQGRAAGIETTAGEQIHADLVVSGVNPKLLYLSMLDPAVLKPETVTHFVDYKCASGSFRMNLALSEAPAFTAATDQRVLTGGIIMAPSLQYMDRAFRDATEHGYSRQPVVEMMVPSMVDESLAPQGQHVCSLFCQQFNPGLGETWLQRKHEAAEVIIDTVTDYAPNFRDSILGMQVLSPYDLESRFGLVGGDIFHGRLSLDQLFSARPMLGSGQYATEIAGLYMCGSGTHPGGGVSGVPGHNAARKILGDM